MRHRSINAVLDLGNASSALVGIYMCEAIYNGDQNRIRRNVTFELRVKCKYGLVKLEQTSDIQCVNYSCVIICVYYGMSLIVAKYIKTGTTILFFNHT